MMTLETFVKTWLNKQCDYDGYYGPQCVDLFRQYLKDVWNIPHTGSVEGAKDIWLKYDSLELEKKFLKKVKAVKPGDVVVFDATVSNRYGHVGIYLAALGESMIVLEQDGYKKDGYKKDGVKITLYSDEKVLGFLRRRLWKQK